MTWREQVLLAEHYEALGIREISVHDEPDFPYELVVSMRHDYHELDGNNCVSFRAAHPSGLILTTYVNLFNFGQERWFNLTEVQKILNQLPRGPLHGEFQDHLLETANTSEKKLQEYLKRLQGEFGIVSMLRTWAN